MTLYGPYETPAMKSRYQALPCETHVKILLHLVSINDLARVERTCKAVRNACREGITEIYHSIDCSYGWCRSEL